MAHVVIMLVAALASALTFFSGFGLGTLLLPAFVFFFPAEQAVAMTAVVHFANGLFKLALTGRNADRGTVLRFGLPAIAAALAGAWTLNLLIGLRPWFTYEIAGRHFSVTPVKFLVGVLLIAFTLWETSAKTKDRTFSAKWMPLGGLLSGFFGGLSGNQGAVRSAFLVKAGLGKEALVGTGAMIACLVDLVRIGVYSQLFWKVRYDINHSLLIAGVAAAFAGAYWGNRKLRKLTLENLQRLVSGMVQTVGIGLASGLL